jgi:pyrimidine and pyridine-specific 5'-nucleotidase
MSQLIDNYLMRRFSISLSDAANLHQQYDMQYGLAIKGLVQHHKIDPLEFNRQVDDALPLEQILHADQPLRKLLLDLDRSKVKLWLFTNAYVNHGRRVLRLLGVEDCFDGITYCDYAAEELVCKPHEDAYENAMRDAAVRDVGDCYFVGKT